MAIGLKIHIDLEPKEWPWTSIYCNSWAYLFSEKCNVPIGMQSLVLLHHKPMIYKLN